MGSLCAAGIATNESAPELPVFEIEELREITEPPLPEEFFASPLELYLNLALERKILQTITTEFSTRVQKKDLQYVFFFLLKLSNLRIFDALFATKNT
jgi:hypothetical protein